MTPALACYFRRTDICGEERIPSNGPVVLIGSHYASFLDAIVMGVYMRRPIYFYVRGDIFQLAIVRWIFAQLHMIPVFSADLAKQDLHKNAESFDLGARILSKGGMLLIFPEGISRLERNLMPFKKAPGRIIMQAFQLDPSIKVEVVPIGIHYSRHAFRADLQLYVGETCSLTSADMQLQDSGEKAPVSPGKVLNGITEKMRKVFEPVVLYVKKDERSLLLENLLVMVDQDIEGLSQEKFTRQRAICANVDALNDAEAQKRAEVMDVYQHNLKKQGIDDGCITHGSRPRFLGWIWFISFPLYLAGLLLNYLPFWFGKYMADTQVTRVDFYTSVRVAVSAIGYILWLFIWLIAALISGSSWIVLGIVLSPVLGWFALQWRDGYYHYLQQQNYERLKKTKPDLIHTWREKRKALLSF